MDPTRKVVHEPSTVGMARRLAQAHADAGLDLFNKLQMVVTESKRREAPGDYLRHLDCAIPAVTCLSLAAEQFLKVIHYQHFGEYPQRHDLVQLFAGLPADCRKSLCARYSAKYSEEVPLEVVYLGLMAGPDPTTIPTPVVPDFPDLSSALEHLRRVFIDWRYIYERMDFTHSLGIHFKALLLVIEACRAQVAEHRGDARVTFGGPL